LLATPLYGNDYATAQTRDVYLPPGQWMDYDTGKLYQGNTTLTGLALPAAKTPLFVGGSGVVLEKKGKTIVARVYPHAPGGKSVFTLPGATQETTVTVSLKNTAAAIVRDGGSQVPNRLERFAWEFAVDPGHAYQVALPVR
jgi:alpha-glucosidase (family GH31 glycosyl hydrolase)